MPDDAGLAGGVDGLEGGVDGLAHGEVLVGFGNALRDVAGVLVECGEVEDHVEESAQVEQAVGEGLQLGGVRAGLDGGAEVVHLPRRVVVQRGERRAVLSADPVADDGGDHAAEGGAELCQVGSDLGVGLGDGGIGCAGLLELDDGQRQTVDVEDDVEATAVLAVHDADLLHRMEGVLVGVGADQAQGGGLFGT